MAELVDFLPVDAAAWLEWRVKEPHTIRVDGPAGSGKTALLGAFAELVGDSVRIAGLADDREPLPYLSPDRGRHLTWIVPAFEVRGLQSELTHLLMRQAIDVVVADDPCAETWALLEDARLAGCRVWASSTSPTVRPKLGADIYLRLAADHRVELITVADLPVFWRSNGRDLFDPGPDPT